MNNVQKFGLMLLRVLFAVFVIALSLDIFSDPTWWEAFGSHFSFFPGDAYKTVGMIAVGVLFIGAIFVFIGALTPIFAALIALVLFVLSADGSWTIASLETILLWVMWMVLSFTGGWMISVDSLFLDDEDTTAFKPAISPLSTSDLKTKKVAITKKVTS